LRLVIAKDGRSASPVRVRGLLPDNGSGISLAQPDPTKDKQRKACFVHKQKRRGSRTDKGRTKDD